MSKVIAAVLDRKGNVVEPEHILHDNGVREVNGVFYGRGKPQVRPADCRRQTSNTEGESLTKQSEATMNGYHVNDMSAIVKRSMQGLQVNGTSRPASFLDLNALPSYEESLNMTAHMNNVFSGLDAHTRARFGHNPLNLVDFLSNKDNYKQAVDMGLLDASVLPAEQSPAGASGAPTGASQGAGGVSPPAAS